MSMPFGGFVGKLFGGVHTFSQIGSGTSLGKESFFGYPSGQPRIKLGHSYLASGRSDRDLCNSNISLKLLLKPPRIRPPQRIPINLCIPWIACYWGKAKTSDTSHLLFFLFSLTLTFRFDTAP